MNSNTFLTSWKTTAGGVATIALGALTTFVGVKIPGFNMDFGSALIAGMALIAAKDGDVTGGTVRQ